MKKSFLNLLCCTMLVATATSCKESEVDQPTNTQRIRATLPTAIIPEDKSKPVELIAGVDYAFTYDYINSNWTVDLADISLQGEDKLSFSSPRIYASGDYNLRLRYNSPFSAKNNETINSLYAIIASNYYWPGIPNTTQHMPVGNLCTVSFNVADKYSVRSFPEIVCYSGTTTSTFNDNDGNPTEFSSKEPLFSVTMDMTAKTAEIIIQNAKFAQAMPSITSMRLTGLTISADNDHCYRISGKDIVPKVGEGQHETPFPQFSFNEIVLYPANDEMTHARCEFTVAGRYQGSFYGSWIK